MHIFFSGISGAGIGPLALLAKQAGYEVSGSDKKMSSYLQYLHDKGICDITIGQSVDDIAELHKKKPIDWLVYSSAVPKENPNHPELVFAQENSIRLSKRDELLSHLLHEHDKKLIAIAGTHGKTTTTAMMIWLFKQLKIPISYSVGAKLSFGDMGEFDAHSAYFVYEADEYDRNFLSFHPEVSVIPGIAYDHPDIYPTKDDYNAAFKQFLSQSESVFMHKEDAEVLQYDAEQLRTDLSRYALLGEVNRKNAQLVVEAFHSQSNIPYERLITIINSFPGVSRRFEKLTDNLYTDYAHTPEKIKGALQLAREVAGDNFIVVYEGLHNTRQHFIKEQLQTLFSGVKKVIVVPSYLAREDQNLEMLTPEKLCEIMREPEHREPAALDEKLKQKINRHREAGDLVLCFTAGGADSLDEWLRKTFVKKQN